MINSSGQSSIQLIIPLLMLLVLMLGLAYLIPDLTTTQTLAIGGGFAVFIVCLASTGAALYILIFSMLLSPEFIVGTAEGNVGHSGVTLRIDDFMILLIAFSWLAKMAVNKELGLFLRTPLNKPIAYYMVICLLSTLLGATFGKVNLMTGFFFVLKYFEYTLVYFMLVNYLTTRKQMENLLWALLITCMIVSIVAIAQIPAGGRITAPFEGKGGEPNTLGGYLLFMISICGGLLLTANSFKRRVVFGGIISMAMIPLIYTQSRSTYGGLIVAAVSFLWLSEKRRWLFPTLILGGLILAFTSPDVIKKRVSYTFTQRAKPQEQFKVGGVRLDTSTTARLTQYERVIRRLPEHPLFGFGVTGFGFIDGQYFRVLIETGIIGFVIFFILVFSILRYSYHVLKAATDPFDSGLCMGFIGGFLGLLAHALGANTFIIVRIMEPFWFVLAMVVIIPDLEAETPDEDHTSK